MKIGNINSSPIISYPGKAGVDNNPIFDGTYQINLQYSLDRYSISTK